jgi:UDP-glucose 4-epimerase
MSKKTIDDYYSGKTVLVTGGAGAIGTNLCQSILLKGAEKVIIFDNLSSSYLWNVPNMSRLLFVKGDIRNKDDLFRVFRHRPQIIFHLAAFFANQNSVDYPLINEEVNVSGLLNILEMSVISGCVERFVFSNSEGGAYGSDSAIPYNEQNISINLSTPYYISKLSGEAYCRFYYQHYNLPVSIVRLFNSFGPGEVPGIYRNVIPNFIYWALKKQAIPLTGDSGMSRDFVYVQDIIEGLLRAGSFSEAIGNSINICSGKEVLIYHLADLINTLTNNDAGVRLLDNRKWDTRNKIIGNPSKCRELLHFSPSFNLEKGLIITIDWFKNNWENIEKSALFFPGQNPALT